MNKQELINQIYAKKSFLCVGLDTDIAKIPEYLLEYEDPVFEFNKSIIDATAEYTIAYKPNSAFYEVYGAKGWIALEKTIAYIKEHYPEIMVIADAKRGDIGNTSANYARAFFETLNADAITVAPYMGFDSVEPFLNFDNKWVILLALTSNKGSKDFQYIDTDRGTLYKTVLYKATEWADSNKLMFVIGATHPEELKEIREILPDYFLLVPGVGAQGGTIEEVAKNGINKECGLIVNSSRGIIYASKDAHFAENAAEEAKKLQQKMQLFL